MHSGGSEKHFPFSVILLCSLDLVLIRILDILEIVDES